MLCSDDQIPIRQGHVFVTCFSRDLRRTFIHGTIAAALARCGMIGSINKPKTKRLQQQQPPLFGIDFKS